MNPARSGAGEHTAVHTHLLVDVYRPLLLYLTPERRSLWQIKDI